MNRRVSILFGFVLAGATVGCGDTPPVVLRDVLTTWNEVTDVAVQIPDDPETADEVAERLLKNDLEVLKKKWDPIKKRVSKLGELDAPGRQAFTEAIDDLKDEAQYTIGRVASEFGGTVQVSKLNAIKVRGRLVDLYDKIRARSPGAGKNVKACIDTLEHFTMQLPNDMKKFETALKLYHHWQFPRGQAMGGFPAGGPPGGGAPGGFPGGPPGGGPPKGFPGGPPGGGPPGGFPGGKGPGG
jgi:hypothetical protein